MKLSDAKTSVLARGQPVENLLLNVPFQPSYSVSGTVAAFDKSNAELLPKILLFNAEHPLIGLTYRQELSPKGSFAFPHVLAGKYWAIVAVEPDDNSKWFTAKVAVEVDNNVSGLSLTLTQRQK